MTQDELLSLQYKVREAEKLKKQIDRLDEWTDEISLNGKCSEISYNFEGIAKHSGWGIEEGERCSMGRSFSSRTIGCSEDEFDEWFSKPLLNFIIDFKKTIEDKLEKME